MGFEPLTERARQVVLSAHQPARALRHRSIRVEHLLLGILTLERGIAHDVLALTGATLARAQAEVERQLGRDAEPAPTMLPFSRDARRVLEQSMLESRARDDGYLGSEHILLALTSEDAGQRVAERILGVPGHAIRCETLRRLDDAAVRAAGGP